MGREGRYLDAQITSDFKSNPPVIWLQLFESLLFQLRCLYTRSQQIKMRFWLRLRVALRFQIVRFLLRFQMVAIAISPRAQAERIRYYPLDLAL